LVCSNCFIDCFMVVVFSILLSSANISIRFTYRSVVKNEHFIAILHFTGLDQYAPALSVFLSVCRFVIQALHFC
jgi:hypothetical protein